MKRGDLTKLALLGIAWGLIFSGSEAQAANPNDIGHHNSYASRNGRGGQNIQRQVYESDTDVYYNSDGEINEQGLLTQLDAKERRIYEGMNAEEKQLVLRLSNQYSSKNRAVKEAQRKTKDSDNQTINTNSKRSGIRYGLFR